MTHRAPMPEPIPMDDRLFSLALELKEAGLAWTPQVGCFVWDHRGRIAQPSPFPRRIYFILSMKRFLTLFNDVEAMKRDLVWLPTWYQARQLLDQLPATREDASADPAATAAEEMIHLYRRLLQRISAADAQLVQKRGAIDAQFGRRAAAWIRSVIASELGSLTRLPETVQSRVETVYGEVAKAYLGWRRIQEGQAEDWLPRETVLDVDLLGDLGHFFSDYQRPIQCLNRIRKVVALLNAIDENKDREEVDRLVAQVLDTEHPQGSPKGIFDRLTSHPGPHPVS